MADVTMPEKKSSTKGLFQVAGTAVGAYFGGPSGAAMGYQAGGMASDMLGKAQQPGQVRSDAMARRAESLQPQQGVDNHMRDLEAAEAAAAQLPEDEQKRYLPAIQQAKQLSQQNRRAME